MTKIHMSIYGGEDKRIPPKHIFDSVTKQAYRYGEQIRVLWEMNLPEDIARVRQAWLCFLNQFPVNALPRRLAWEAYNEAYFQ